MQSVCWILAAVLIVSICMMLFSQKALAVSDSTGGNAYADAAKLFIREDNYYGNNDIWFSIYTRGAYGSRAWCADFVSAVAKKMGINSSVIPRSAGADKWSNPTDSRFHSLVTTLTVSGKTYDWQANGTYDPSYVPKVGDIVTMCWNSKSLSRASHVGIVTSVNTSTHKFTYLSGNYTKTTKYSGTHSYGSAVTPTVGKKNVLGFFHPNWSAVSSYSSPTPVTGVSITSDVIVLEAGSKVVPSVTVTPSNAFCDVLIWTSSDPSVAQVDKYSGEITAVANGNATITATAIADGKNSSSAAVKDTLLIQVGNEASDYIYVRNELLPFGWREYGKSFTFYGYLESATRIAEVEVTLENSDTGETRTQYLINNVLTNRVDFSRFSSLSLLDTSTWSIGSYNLTFDFYNEYGTNVYTISGGAIVVNQSCSHTPTYSVTVVEPTCTEVGESYSYCDKCFCLLSKYEDIPALGHTPGAWITVTEPTTSQTGLQELRCSVCDALISSKVLPKVNETGLTEFGQRIDESNGHIYLLISGNISWENANTYAQSYGEGWQLACMDGDSANEQALIEALVDSFGKACWLGGNNLSGTWRWLSGKIIDLDDSRWDDDEPSGVNKYGSQENYLGIYGSSNQTQWSTINKWNDFNVDSTTPKGFVIEYTPSTELDVPEIESFMADGVQLSDHTTLCSMIPIHFEWDSVDNAEYYEIYGEYGSLSSAFSGTETQCDIAIHPFYDNIDLYVEAYDADWNLIGHSSMYTVSLEQPSSTISLSCDSETAQSGVPFWFTSSDNGKLYYSSGDSLFAWEANAKQFDTNDDNQFSVRKWYSNDVPEWNYLSYWIADNTGHVSNIVDIEITDLPTIGNVRADGALLTDFGVSTPFELKETTYSWDDVEGVDYYELVFENRSPQTIILDEPQHTLAIAPDVGFSTMYIVARDYTNTAIAASKDYYINPASPDESFTISYDDSQVVTPQSGLTVRSSRRFTLYYACYQYQSFFNQKNTDCSYVDGAYQIVLPVEVYDAGKEMVCWAVDANGDVSNVLFYYPVAEYVPVTSMSLLEDYMTLWLGDTSTYFSDWITFEPENATNKGIIYPEYDDGIIHVDSEGQITALNVGESSYTIYSADNPGISCTFDVFVNKQMQWTIGNVHTNGDGSVEMDISVSGQGKYDILSMPVNYAPTYIEGAQALPFTALEATSLVDGATASIESYENNEQWVSLNFETHTRYNGAALHLKLMPNGIEDLWETTQTYTATLELLCTYSRNGETFMSLVLNYDEDIFASFTVTYPESTVTGSCGDSLTYVLSDGVLTISGTGAMVDSPSGLAQPWKDHLTEITQVIVNPGATSIGKNAFRNCTNLTSVTLPDSVTSIGQMAFYHAESLSSITLPANLTSIGYSAFGYCKKLTQIAVPEGVTEIPEAAFNNCTLLSSITLPEGLQTIGNTAFAYCALTSLELPDGLGQIGSGCFAYCASLSEITIPASVTSIGESAFDSCPGVVIRCYSGSAAHTYAVDNQIAFELISGPASEYDFILPAYMKQIKTRAFIGIAAASVKLPDGLQTIGGMAFANCPNLTLIYIPASCTSIAYNAFSNVSGLTIRGEAGSYAEDFADMYGFDFEAVN